MTGPRRSDRWLRWPGPALLLLWGGALVWLLVGGRYRDFLRPSLWPLVLAAAVLSFAFLAAMLLRPAGAGHSRESAILRTAVMALPLLYVLAGHGKTLGSDAYGTRAVDPLGSALERSGMWSDPDDAAGGRLTVPAILRRGPALVGKTVTTIGQVGRGHGEPEGHFVLFRFVVTCCAADALPQGFLVAVPDGSLPAKDTWVEVHGTLESFEMEGRAFLLLRPETLRTISPPDPAYLYGF